MSDSRVDFVLGDARATLALGAALARSFLATLSGGAVVFFRGELGAGKTTCVRSLLRALGVDGLIRSPTYTLVEVYPSVGVLCVHADLYRLAGPLEVDELALRDYLDGVYLLLVEWPEKGAAALPPPDLELTLAYSNEGRAARIDARTERGRRWLSMLLNDTSLIPYVSN